MTADRTMYVSDARSLLAHVRAGTYIARGSQADFALTELYLRAARYDESGLEIQRMSEMLATATAREVMLGEILDRVLTRRERGEL